MPILKVPPKKPKTASLQIRIEEEVRQQLDHYAEFIDASPPHVVTEALKLLFKRDEEFKRWSTQHTNHNNNPKPKGGKSLFETVKLASSPAISNSICARTQTRQECMACAWQ